VYNSAHDIVRVVTIVPDRAWGGDGALGFNIGYGLLHQIPAVSEPDVVFDSEAPMQTAFQLAQQSQSQPQPAPPNESQDETKSSNLTRPTPLGRRRASHSAAHSKRPIGVDDILKEGEERSEKEDFAPSTVTGGLPPPPTAKRPSPPVS
jgi:GRASP55/65 PDZ-like domain